MIITFTCPSVIPSEKERRARSGPAKYFVCSNIFSKAYICWPVNVGRVLFLSLRINKFRIYKV